MTERCARTGCRRAAKWAPKLNVPATGWPLAMHRPLSALMSMFVCDDHFAELKAADFVGAAAPENLRRIFDAMASGKAAPDFERAFFSKVRIGSAEHRQFEQAREQAKGGKPS